MGHMDEIKCTGCGELLAIVSWYGHHNYDDAWCKDCWEAMAGVKWEDLP